MPSVSCFIALTKTSGHLFNQGVKEMSIPNGFIVALIITHAVHSH